MRDFANFIEGSRVIFEPTQKNIEEKVQEGKSFLETSKRKLSPNSPMKAGSG